MSPLLVGIGGGTASGKTTVAVRLAEALGTTASILDMDSYYRGRAAAEAVGHAHYRIPDRKTSRKPPKPALQRFGIVVNDRNGKAAAQRGLDHEV